MQSRTSGETNATEAGANGCRSLALARAIDCRAAIWSNVRVNIRGRFLAIDYGEKNIGLAYSDALAITVQPLPSIRNTGLKDLKRKLKSLAEELEISALVVGLPLNMDGSGNDSVRRIEKLMHQLESAIKVPMAAFDERLSTVEAEEYWGRMNTRQKKKYRTIDSLAAALILERFLKEL